MKSVRILHNLKNTYIHIELSRHEYLQMCIKYFVVKWISDVLALFLEEAKDILFFLASNW